MKRSKLLGLTLTAIVAITAVVAASASALPELLGQEANATFEGKNTAANPTLETTKAEKIVCKEATENGVQETPTLGAFHFHFTGCESSGFKCNSSGDETGIVLALGTFHYVYDALGTGEELGIAVLFLPEEQTIKCTALVTLKVKGSVLCSISEPFTFATTHKFQCTQSGGKPSQTSWWNDEAAEQNAKLETSKNGGAFIESGEQAEGSFTFSVGVAFKGLIQFTAPTKTFTLLNETLSATIENKSGAEQKVEKILISLSSPGGKYFTIPNAAEQTTCEKLYTAAGAGSKCSFLVQYVKKGVLIQETLEMKVKGYALNPARALLGN